MDAQSMMEQWLYLLRSGNYKQGTQYLKQVTNEGSEYCCLGLIAEGILDLEQRKVGGIVEFGEDKLVTLLDPTSARILGLEERLSQSEIDYLSTKFPSIYFDTISWARQRVLAALNDEAKLSFTEVADIVEEMGWDNVDA